MSKPARRRVEAWIARLLFRVTAMLPLDVASGLLGGLARLIGPLLGLSRVARRNLARAFPEKSAAEIEAIVADVWENLGRVTAEFPHLGRIARERVQIVGEENAIALRDDGRPGLFFSGHFANWELNGAVAALLGVPLHLVYREANNPDVDRLYRQAREGIAASLIPKGSTGARLALDVLRRGGHLGMLIDQKMNDGIAIPFLGRTAMTAPALAQFALKSRCPVVPACVTRLKGAHFLVTIFPPLSLPDSGDRQADVVALMNAVNALLGEWVRANPGQWLWLHRRWPD
ncbi:MAG: lauroyl acyltransferase [Magnetospirillum sp.]|nr:lauroyl acyltransferase [Magnetospirillum sp.]